MGGAFEVQGTHWSISFQSEASSPILKTGRRSEGYILGECAASGLDTCGKQRSYYFCCSPIKLTVTNRPSAW